MSGHQFALHLRGLPWSATKAEISEFLEGRAQPDDCFICLNREGRPSGEAYVGFNNQEDFSISTKKHKQNMGSRYIEIYESNVDEMQNVMEMHGAGRPRTRDDFGQGGQDGQDGPENEFCIKMRGLPYSATDHDIIDFFEGCNIQKGGIIICLGQNGSPSGDALVRFEDRESQDTAMGCHKKNMGQRYIELFKSSAAEFNRVRSGQDFGRGNSGGGGAMRHGRGGGRPSPYGGGGHGGHRGGNGGGDMEGLDANGQYKHIVHMRGLPYRATENEISRFFAPVETLAVRIIYGRDDRPTGEADVAFYSHDDAQQSMGRNKQHLGSRYVELFLRSTNSDPGRWGNAGSGGVGGGGGGGYGGHGGGGGYGGHGDHGGYGGGHGGGRRGGGYGGRGDGGYGGRY